MTYPTNLRYTREHEWIRRDGDAALVGITDHAQHELGDIVFVEFPKPGAALKQGEAFGTVESVKAVSEIFAPVDGTVLEVNESLNGSPELLNRDPHGTAWLIKVRLADPAQLDELLDAAAYEALIG